ncbi:MAG: nascent polypeptide-associated complex protein, partial [Candidatus Bathyarchaeota archaeon]|nr:nascent polypeptide-associated complex protein [Candidatus Bathyarchaeota archaeon]
MAHKAFRSIKGIPQGRNAMRMMQRMGMETNEIKDVIEVIIKTADKDIIIEEPNVMSLVMDRQKIFQVIGGNQREEIPDQDTVEISENDIKLVAEQANVDAEEARHALEESGGDLARA